MGVLAANKSLIPAREVWMRYGICRHTLTRWMEQPDLSFPQPIVINGRRYWAPSTLDDWEKDRVGRPATKAA